MSQQLQGRRVAILATDGVEQVELTGPRQALEQAGAQVDLISIEPGQIQGFQHFDKGESFKVDRIVGEANAADYDALVLPGGVANPDTLRTDPKAVQFVRDFFAAGKPVGAICHGPWMLIEADVVRHRNVTSWPSLRTDIVNAGGCWADEPVRVDHGLVTSRKPDDMPVFNAKLIEEIAEGTHRAAATGSNGHTQTANTPAIPPGQQSTVEDGDAAVEISSADSFPASDAPSSLQVT